MMLITPPASLVSLLQPWADFYNDSKLTETLVLFAHVGALVVGGGIAIAADRTTLRLNSDVDRRRHVLDVLALHRTVLASLAVIVISGLLLLAADIETFWASWIYWAKMLLVVLLLINGWRMQRVEQVASTEAVVSAAHWSALRGTAMVSVALWLAVTFAGIALVNYA